MSGSIRLFFLSVIATTALSACGGGGGGESGSSPPPPANNAPQANDLNIQTNESEMVSGTLPATDTDGDTLTFAIGTQPQKGQVDINNTTTGSFSYTPNPGESGSDEFAFTATDGIDTSTPGTVSISINGVPTATDISQTISNVDLTPWDGALSASDPDGDPITYTFLSSPSKGTLTSTDTATGTFTYEPNAGQSGTDSFQFEVSDGFATSTAATVTVIFNAAPAAMNASLDALEAQSTNGTLQASDAENDALIFSIISAPNKGVVNITDVMTGAYIYTSNNGESGADSFMFMVNDGLSNSIPATVDVTIYQSPLIGFVDASSLSVENKTETVLLSVSAPLPFDISIQIQAAGTATAVDDYEILTGIPVIVPPLSTEAQIDIAIIGDTLDEDETIELTLANAVNANIDPSASTHTLVLDDWRGTMSLDLMNLGFAPGRRLPGLALDAADNIIVVDTGTTTPNPPDVTLFALVQKFDKRGVELWTKTYSRGIPTEDDMASDVTVDSSGNIYVAGLQGLSNNLKGFVMKLDADGNQIWRNVIDGASTQEATGIALDSLGNIYVTGTTFGVLGGQTHLGSADAFLMKIDSGGTVQWTRQFGSALFEFAVDVVVGSLGQIYIGIRGRGALGVTAAGPANDVFLVRFASDGTPEWARSFGSVSDDGVERMSIDAADNVYMIGAVDAVISRPGNTHSGSNDVYVAKFSGDGVEQWIRMLGDANAEEGYGIIVDAFADVYVTGHWGTRSFIAKYDSAGVLDWADAPNTIGLLEPSGKILMGWSGYAIAEDSKGNFFVLGEQANSSGGYLIKVDSTGAIFD
jgi:hypothetical protein